MALGIKSKPVTNPELEKFKKTVVDTSKKYAKKHNLCGVVDEALKEMGIDGKAKTVAATAKVLIEVELTAALNESDFAGLNPQEELDKASQLFRENVKVTVPMGRVSKVTPLVTTLEKASNSNDIATTGFYKGYVGKYSSNEGRVLHLFPADTDFSSRAGYGGVQNVVLCRDNNLYYAGWSSLRDESARATGRICVKCQKVADRV